MLHMLDTDIASYIIKDRPPGIRAKLASIRPSTLCVSVITRAELLYGLKSLAPDHRLHIGVRHFLRNVRALPWDEDAAGHHADIRHQLTSTGQLIGELDMMIGAHALSANAMLVTNNARHFSRIAAPLMMADWLRA